ncbi:adhesion G protein-coupled receptor F4-like [Dunckerocampus dactyliophorus]|uniref:adhesion G protein-coupled receptor F4-like n=1 Tax=Dunckerocampus dactyliophorus TaxID=161453 RepID=UPI002406C70F|nr:adhesion G protein-coupled receptor F4-like [Dunckerocampus dactyliophorus]
MVPMAFMYLTATVYMYYQALAAGMYYYYYNYYYNDYPLSFLRNVVRISYYKNVYTADLVVESNVTLQAVSILSVFNTITNLRVTDANGTSHRVMLVGSELVAVHLEVTAILQNGATWDSNKTKQLETAFRGLNGVEHLNLTGLRGSNSTADFEMDLSCKSETSKLQEIVSNLETSLGAVVWVNITGTVTLESSEPLVPYMSEPTLKCTLEEASSDAGWKMCRADGCFELNNGSVVKLDTSCATKEYNSCIAVTLHNITSNWAGTYECAFTVGSIRHTAKTELRMALLPDEISMMATPPTVHCSNSTENVTVDIKVTVPYVHEMYEAWWSYKGGKKKCPGNTSGDFLYYHFETAISCQKTKEAHYMTVTFKNNKDQQKSARLDIPVIYEGERFCREDGDWPKTPDGHTVVKQTCPNGRVGNELRTCTGNKWQPVFSKCVSEQLFSTLKEAQRFITGQGSTHEAAMGIFQGLKNSSMSDSDSSGRMADLMGSIHILGLMANASENIAIQDNVLPDFINAASNMLDQTWDGVNKSVIHDMSSHYLRSVENLVKNIEVNKSEGLTTQNLDLKFCPSGNCNLTLFNSMVNLKTFGLVKTVAVKNLTDKLRNNFPNTEASTVLISATLENMKESSIRISLDFFNEQQTSIKHVCVFWNISERKWSEDGCVAQNGIGGRRICLCNHLTPFSYLIDIRSTTAQSLEILTTVGLSVSICSLVIFLVIEFVVWSKVVKTTLSHVRHTVMVNMAVFLLLAHCSFLASNSPDLPDTWCCILSICKHLFFLATFGWMLCLSLVLVHQLIFVFRPLRKRVFMFFSSFVGYVCPMLIVGSTYGYCRLSNKRYYATNNCWLVYRKPFGGSLLAFLVPVATVTLTNIFCVVVVIVTLLKSSVPDGSKADYKETAKSILRVVVLLTPVFGLTWVPGFVLLMLDAKDVMFAVTVYSFTILNSFQGLSILLTGCLAEQKVREELSRLLTSQVNSKGRKKKPKTYNIQQQHT